jgi:hypothetical protein
LFKSFGISAIMLIAATSAYAQDMGSADAQPSATPTHSTQQDSWAHPELSTNDGWAGDMLWIVALGFFLPAAIIGPFIRKRVAAELPELHASEEADALTASQQEPGHSLALRIDE